MRSLLAISALIGMGLSLGALSCTVVQAPAPASDPQGLVVAGPDPSSTGTAPPIVDEPGWGIRDREPVRYADVVRKVTGMTSDRSALDGARRRGMDLMSVMWEDTGRFEGSSVGPNISDLTLQVRYTDNGVPKAGLLPVIRFPNFSDRTGDIPADRFFVRVGNQSKQGALETVLLTDVLRDLKKYVSDPSSVRGSGNLLASRDSHFLVSAQAVFLPVPKEGRAEFTPVLFNYQSSEGNPAVLTLVITRQGTSVTVIENDPDETSPVAANGQELFFNHAGERAPFIAERRSDVVARIEGQGGPKTADDRSAIAKGADVLFVVQVPLVHASRRRSMDMESVPMAAGFGGGAAPPPSSAADQAASPKKLSKSEERSDVETAVLGHGKVEGKFSEGRSRSLVRDTRFPIRVTVQFYKATSNGVVEDADLDAISRAIGNVYEHADFVGSLVLPGDDRRRPTSWNTMPDWFGL